MKGSDTAMLPAHGKDESVVIDEVIAAARSLAAAVVDWCGPAAGGEN